MNSGIEPFEVGGRVEFVVEPETDIAGQMYDKDGNVLSDGTLLARLDPTRFELAVESAGAQVTVAERQLEAAQIEYEQVIPESIAAAAVAWISKTEPSRLSIRKDSRTRPFISHSFI